MNLPFPCPRTPPLPSMYLVRAGLGGLGPKQGFGARAWQKPFYFQLSGISNMALFGIVRFFYSLYLHTTGIWVFEWKQIQSLAILHNSISFLFPLTDYLPPQPWTHCQLGNNSTTVFLNQLKYRPMCDCIPPSLTWCTPRCILRESRPHALASNPFFTAGNFIETFVSLVQSIL